MGKKHGKRANWSWDAVQFEDELDELTLELASPEAEITTFNNAWRTFLSGKITASMNFSGSFDPAVSQLHASLIADIGGGVKSVVIDFTGAGPGTDDPTYKATASGLTGALIASYSMSFPVGEKASHSGTIQHSGLTVRATA